MSAFDARFKNDATGASAYDPRVMLKIVLLGYSRGLISRRGIERACRQNVQFMALSNDSQPSYTHIAKFVRELRSEIQALFTQVLLTCDRLGLIGRQMLLIDGGKLPSNASQERSGTMKNCAIGLFAWSKPQPRYWRLPTRRALLEKAARHRSETSGDLCKTASLPESRHATDEERN